MIFQFILLQFSAHMLADFIFQPNNWNNLKRNKILTWHHFYHGLVIFIFSYLLSFDFNFCIAAIILSGTHLITDILKSYIELRSQTNNKKSNYFFIDQIIHIISFSVISYLYYYYYGINYIVEIPTKIIVLATGFILCAKPTNIFIKNIFIAFSIEIPLDTKQQNENSDTSQNNDRSLPNAGKIIGIMERFLVLSLIMVGQFSAVGLIIAAKSILRFKSTQKNEYILVGTLLSFGIAVIIGILISKFYLSVK